jgi:hypothetical protein
MNAEQLSVERDLWAVQIKQAFKEAGDSYQCAEHFSPTLIRLIVTRPPSDWWCKIAILSKSNRTQLELDDRVLAFSMNDRTKAKLLEALQTRYDTYAASQSLAQEREREARQWAERQAKELNGFCEYKGVSFQIIPGFGRYRVIFDDGHPLEQLTLKQVRAFYEFLKTLDAQIQT